VKDCVPCAVAIADGVIYQRIRDEAVLLNMDNQQYYGLNSTATEFWESLIELSNVHAAEDRLSETFSTARESLRLDLRNLVRELIEAGLLKAVDP
jgi:hypothetical protein